MKNLFAILLVLIILAGVCWEITIYIDTWDELRTPKQRFQDEWVPWCMMFISAVILHFVYPKDK